MKNIIKLSAIALALILSLSGCSGNQLFGTKKSDKDIFVIETTAMDLSTEDLIASSDLIVKGTLVSVDEGVMTNPTQSKEIKNESGRTVINEQIHTYDFEIDTVYKGTCTDTTVKVKTTNGAGLSADLILHGEDDQSILSEELDRFDMEVGTTCILTLRYLDSGFEASRGYYVYGEESGIFTPEQAELFANLNETT